MKLNLSACTLATALALGSMAAPTAMAAMPNSMSNIQTAEAVRGSAVVRNVQWRPGFQRGWRGSWRRGPHWRGRGHRIGPAIGAGIAALIIGGAIAASRRDYRDRWEECDERYRSFRWSDGTFQPYGGGPRQLCPYLHG
jgi:hypothetical protein